MMIIIIMIIMMMVEMKPENLGQSMEKAYYLYPEQADRITALLGADTRGVHGSLGGDLGAPLHRPQPATHRPPAPAQACDVLYICIHSNVWRRTCTFTATRWRR